MRDFDPLAILEFFYPEDTPLRRLLLEHSGQVRDKALALLAAAPATEPLPERRVVVAGALLHDLGIGRCHAPGIGCLGTEPYLAHGVIGARMLREYGRTHGLEQELEPCARICERHTGSGITAAAIRKHRLPLPVRDYLPETPEEQLICLADKFYSKSGDRRELSPERIRRQLARFGADSVARFDALCARFGL